MLTEGDFQEAALFFNFRMPVGYRAQLANVRSAKLNLLSQKARLEDLELNATHLLTGSIRNVDFAYVAAQSHFNRWKAAQEEVRSVEALFQAAKTTLDLVLDAQRRRAQAQVEYYRSLIEYNKGIAEVHYRKGSLLDYNNVRLAEGPWHEKAYWDALGRARERDASYYFDYGWTNPKSSVAVPCTTTSVTCPMTPFRWKSPIRWIRWRRSPRRNRRQPSSPAGRRCSAGSRSGHESARGSRN